MGYFTETMALFETKSECKQDYAGRRAGEKIAGDHAISKFMRDNKAALRKEADHYNDDRKPMRTADDYRNRESYASGAAKRAERVMNSSNFRKDARKSLGLKEAFDAVVL